jgi:EPS-associated MarR family transcriptional regulator
MNAISVQILNDMSDNLDHFEVLRKIKSKPNSSQRELASELGFSLGKLNYCLRALKNKGLIKIKNFQKDPNKFRYAYILTPKGISAKTSLTLNFMKRKMAEYDELKSEIEEDN